MSGILGIWDGHGASVALVSEGELVFALAEERPRRIKRYSGFPSMALAACLDFAQRHGIEVAEVALAGQYGRGPLRLLEPLYAGRSPHRKPLGRRSRAVMAWENRVSASEALQPLDEALGRGGLRRRLAELPEPERVDHHEAHAFSALMTPVRGRSLVLTADAYGEGTAATVRLSNAPRSVLQRLDPGFGLALLYGAVTVALGFEEGDEGKVMGLAARGRPETAQERFAQLFERVDRAPRLRAPLRQRALSALLSGLSREDAAAGLQAFVEREGSDWVEGLLSRFPEASGLSLAGGLFANVRLNQRLAELPGVRSLFVFPEMGDGGLSAGAAAWLWYQRHKRRVTPLRHASLGCAFDEEGLAQAAQDAGLQEVDASPTAIAARLAAGEVVCRFAGREEFGPRALGKRSVLFAPGAELARRVNEGLGRDPIMAFAPVLMESRLPWALAQRTHSDLAWMTVTAQASEALAQACPAAVHIDGSTRPQALDPALDPALHSLLQAADARGLPALINTSFNLHGEPIVHTPGDAVSTLCAAGFEVLLGERRAWERRAPGG